MFGRREFLCGSIASTIFAKSLLAQSQNNLTDNSVYHLKAQKGKTLLVEPGQQETMIWGYNGTVPGPEIRVRQGKPFAADLINELDIPTTIHWHGIRIDNKMDGVAGLTQEPVKSGAIFKYRFVPPDAGTYWYHPHYKNWAQQVYGLYGAFVVEEHTPPKVDQDIVLVFDDWRLDRNNQIHLPSLGNIHDKSHAGRLGNVITLNGLDTQDISVKQGERVRLRLINAANARVMDIHFAKHRTQVIALDGQPIEPFFVDDDRIIIAPAQRVDLIIDLHLEAGTKTPINVYASRQKLILGHLIYDKRKRSRSKALSDKVVLPQNPIPTKLDLKNAKVVKLEMTGGARSPFRSAEYRGEQHNIRELVREYGKMWAFNGIVGKPLSPIGKFSNGQTVIFKIMNKTAWLHAMHFHGHHVKEIDHSARKPHPYWRDTILISAKQAVDVVFVAHNPGRWMLHCHMLEHQAGGMSTWYEVS